MPQVITALDPDTPAAELHFSVVSAGGTEAGKSAGFLEMTAEPGKSIGSFTQADLQAGKVW